MVLRDGYGPSPEVWYMVAMSTDLPAVHSWPWGPGMYYLLHFKGEQHTLPVSG